MTRIYRKEEVEAIKPAKESVEKDFMEMENVTGVGIGPKIVNGEYTDELAIQVYVKEKKEKKDLKKNEIIPKTVDDIKTDIIERTFVLQHLPVLLDDIALMEDAAKYDTLMGGISIGPCRSVYLQPPEVPQAGYYVFVGTLGAVVKDNATGNKMLLSNFHVMCVDNGWKVGDKMAQPSLVDGGKCPADVVGELQRAALNTDVDCAVSSHTARPISCEIKEIGNVTGTANAAVGLAVRKRGRTTGLTYGKIDSVNLTVQIDYGNGLGVKTLTNQIHIEPDKTKSPIFGNHGDSGSAVVNDKNEIVGLHFAGGQDAQGNPVGDGIANTIQAVLNALNVSVCTPSVVKPICKVFGRDFRICRLISKDTPTCKPLYRDITFKCRAISKDITSCKTDIIHCKNFMVPPCGDVICEIPHGPQCDLPDITQPGPITRLADMGYSNEDIVAYLQDLIMEIEDELEEMRYLVQSLSTEEEATTTQGSGSGICMSTRDMIKPCNLNDLTCVSSSMIPCTLSKMIPCKPSRMIPCNPSKMFHPCNPSKMFPPCNPSKMLPVCEIPHGPQCDLPLPDKPGPDPWWWKFNDEEKADYLEALAEEKEAELEDIRNMAQSMRSGEDVATQGSGAGLCMSTRDMIKPCPPRDLTCVSSSMIPCTLSKMIPCKPYRMMPCKPSQMVPCSYGSMHPICELPCRDIYCRDVEINQIDPRIPRDPVYEKPIEQYQNPVQHLVDMGYSDEEIATYLEEVAKQTETELEDTRDMIKELRGQGNSHFRRLTRR